MKLRVVVPSHVVVDESGIDEVVAEGRHGSFCLLPRHVDFLAALAPGLLSYVRGGEESFLAVDGGTLVKCGEDVLVSTTDAITGADLGRLRKAAEAVFESVDEQERRARDALIRMEADLVRGFIELEEERRP